MPPVSSVALPFRQNRKKRVPVIAEHRWLELLHPSVTLYVRQRLRRWIFHSYIYVCVCVHLLLFLSWWKRWWNIARRWIRQSSSHAWEAFPSFDQEDGNFAILDNCETDGEMDRVVESIGVIILVENTMVEFDKFFSLARRRRVFERKLKELVF